MNLEFACGMDPNSYTINRDGKSIGFVQNHDRREPRIVIHKDTTVIKINELKEILDFYESNMK